MIYPNIVARPIIAATDDAVERACRDLNGSGGLALAHTNFGPYLLSGPGVSRLANLTLAQDIRQLPAGEDPLIGHVVFATKPTSRLAEAAHQACRLLTGLGTMAAGLALGCNNALFSNVPYMAQLAIGGAALACGIYTVLTFARDMRLRNSEGSSPANLALNAIADKERKTLVVDASHQGKEPVVTLTITSAVATA